MKFCHMEAILYIAKQIYKHTCFVRLSDFTFHVKSFHSYFMKIITKSIHLVELSISLFGHFDQIATI